MKKNTACPRGDSCTFAHNVFEYWLHPSRYRTQLCNDGINCARKICFFAHTMEELRVSSVKVIPPDSAATKLASPSGSDAWDPFNSLPEDAGKNRSSTSPVSPLCLDPWDPSSSDTSRRSSLQLQQKNQHQHQQRMSLDQMAMRPRDHRQHLLQQRHNSVDLAELQLQQLQLSAMQAQLQLQQNALHNLAAVQHDASRSSPVDQLAQALAHFQLANSLANSGDQSHMLVPNLTQVVMQQMLMQQQVQQAQGHMLQQLHGPVSHPQQSGPVMHDVSGAGLDIGMFAPGQQASYAASLAAACTRPNIQGTGGVSLGDYSMGTLPGPDIAALQELRRSSQNGGTQIQYAAHTQSLLQQPVAFERMYSQELASHRSSNGSDDAAPK